MDDFQRKTSCSRGAPPKMKVIHSETFRKTRCVRKEGTPPMSDQQELIDLVREDLRMQLLEVSRIERCDYEQCIALMRDRITAMQSVAHKYEQLLQEYIFKAEMR
jgi:hypothetical protein